MSEVKLFVDGGVAAAKLAWRYRASLTKVATELFSIARHGRTKVLIFGASGVGKSTVGKLLAGTLTDEALLKGYQESRVPEALPLQGAIGGRILVAPGQRRRWDTWPDLQRMIAVGQISGIINVVAYGYHAVQDIAYEDHPLFATTETEADFMRAYLDDRREEELSQFRAIAERLRDASNRIWFMTLVLKQDLWWNRRVEVNNFYVRGPYAAIIEEIAASKRLQNVPFPHEFASASLTWENLADGQHKVLAETVGGYDQRLRLANLSRFGSGLGQLLGIKL